MGVLQKLGRKILAPELWTFIANISGMGKRSTVEKKLLQTKISYMWTHPKSSCRAAILHCAQFGVHHL